MFKFLMCLFAPITRDKCPKGRAGIAKAWVTACENVVNLVFDVQTREITALIMNGAPTAGRFVPIEFEKNTAFFEQAKSKVKSGTNVAQTINFIEPGLNALTRRLLEDLNDCCCYHVIVKDNEGQLHYFGISFYKDSNTWSSEDMQTGEGSSNSGADPTADSAEYNETLTGNVNFYAPFLAITEAQIPI